MKKILSLFDLHIPFNIPLGPVLEFVKDFKPNVIILGGDVGEWGCVSHWVCNQSRALDHGTISQAYEDIEREIIFPLADAAPYAKKIFLTGNHEDWLRKAAEADPNLRGFIELERNLKGWKIYPFNVPYRAGKNLCYIHGTYHNKYHARTTADAFVGSSVIYGHVHSMQSFSNISPVDSKHFYRAQSLGCLCNLNPEFMKNKPNAWIHGFGYCYLNDDGTFHDVPVVIVRNKFWAEGRLYK